MKMEVGKCYKMVVCNLKAIETYTVFFKVEKMEEEKTFYVGLEGAFKVYSNDRITMERNHKTNSSRIGTWTGRELVPWNRTIYKYLDLKEISEEEFKQKKSYAKYGL